MFYIVMFNITMVYFSTWPHVCIYLNFVFGIQCIAHMLLGDANKKKNQSKEKWKDISIYRIIVSFIWKQNLGVLIDEMSNKL